MIGLIVGILASSAHSYQSEFSPQSTAELADAIRTCTTLSPRGYCQNSLNPAIGQWEVSGATSMHKLFFKMKYFDQDISNWNVSRVTNMESMFFWAQSFTGYGLGRWNVSRVRNMAEMFFKALSFDSDISTWDVSHVTDMSQMFVLTKNFNSDISRWKVSSVTNMAYMFTWAISFNADISDWDVSQVNSMERMFAETESFDRTLSGCAWVHSKANQIFMFLSSHGSIATTSSSCGDPTTLTTPVAHLSSTQISTPGIVITMVPSISTAVETAAAAASMTRIAAMNTTAITLITLPNLIAIVLEYASAAILVLVILVLVIRVYASKRIDASSLNTPLIVKTLEVTFSAPSNAFPPREETNSTGKQAHVASEAEHRSGRITIKVSLPSQHQIDAMQSAAPNRPPEVEMASVVIAQPTTQGVETARNMTGAKITGMRLLACR